MIVSFDDENAVHILACDDDKAIATARMLDDGHIGRLAVLKDYRKQDTSIGKLSAVSFC